MQWTVSVFILLPTSVMLRPGVWHDLSAALNESQVGHWEAAIRWGRTSVKRVTERKR